MTDDTQRNQDRKALVTYFSLVTVLCIILYAFIFTGRGLDALGGYVLPLMMWAPGVAGLVTTLVIYRSFSPLGLLGNRSTFVWIIACIAVPIVYTLLIKQGLAAAGVIKLPGQSLPVVVLVLGLFVSLGTALGEELGWRGFAAPVLARVYGFWPGQLMLGAYWFLYHLPGLLGTSYGSSPHPIAGNLMFGLSCIFLSCFLGAARLKSDSVWPSAFFHASHNFFFQNWFEPAEAQSSAADYLVGEQGLMLLVMMAVLLAYTRRAIPPARIGA